MPISGSLFANEIGLCKVLLEAGYKPNIIMGTSGGCISGVVLLLCEVNRIRCKKSYEHFCIKLQEILLQLDSSWYLNPWSSNIFLSRGIALAQGSLYARGNGESLVRGLKIGLDSQPEMWIGTRCKTTGKHQLFCTRGEDNCKIKLPEAIYADGCVDLITKASIASCAVPTLVPGIDINGLVYHDGGMKHASPLGPCSNAFIEEQVSYHVVYISPVRYSREDDPLSEEIEDDDTWNQLSSSMAGMVRGLHIPDRNNGIRMVGPNAKKTVGRGIDALHRALNMQLRATRSFIELAPVTPVHVNFLQMKRGEALHAVEKAYNSEFTVRHWYV